MIYISNYKFKRIFYIITVLSLWLSIDSHLINFKFENFKDFSILIRAAIPFFIFIILIINLEMSYIKKFINKNNAIPILFFMLYLIQIPALLYTGNSILNIGFIINCITYLFFLFFFIDDLNKSNFFLKISLIIFTFVLLIYGFGLYKYLLFDSASLNLYGSWPHGLESLKFSDSVPRSSGIARSAMIIFIIFSLIISVKNLNALNIFLITFSLLLVLLTQSRIINIFLLLYIFFYLFLIIYQKKKFINKIINLSVIFILPGIVFANLIFFQKSKVENLDKISISKNQKQIESYYKNQKFFRPLDDKKIGFGSGRFNDWRNIISKSKNYKLGYGAMGDRYLINQSASNFLLYIYASSGILGLIIAIFFLIKVFFYINRKIIFLHFKITKKNYKFFICYILVIFILFRSLAESSFGIFGIDFLIFAGSLHYILLYKRKFKKKTQ